jgi:hypothetical protein
MAKRGIFKSVGRLTTTTLDKTESVAYSSLDTVDESMQAVSKTFKAFNNDAKEDLLDSILSLSKKKREVYDELIELGYDEEAATAMVNDI